jgi:predicted ATPase
VTSIDRRNKLDRLTLKGFKSFESLEDFELRDLNVLIGANGAGKSNFVEFFRLMRAMVYKGLQTHVKVNGPSDTYFYNGIGTTEEIVGDLRFGLNRYVYQLAPAADGGMVIVSEHREYRDSGLFQFSRGVSESLVADSKDQPGATGSKHGVGHYVWEAISGWQVYHFHDTSRTAGMRRPHDVLQTDRLYQAGENLAPFLWRLRSSHPQVYDFIRQTVQRIAPFIDDFDPRVPPGGRGDQVMLTWRRKGAEYIFWPNQLSDGTIRFICLVTALFQPNPPQMIVLDEPELGLHPEAISILGGLLRSASTRMQVVVATQSPLLIDECAPEDIITVDQVGGATRLARLDAESLREWLADYSLADLWLKGNLGGGVRHA